jgi:hypothetical protein
VDGGEGFGFDLIEVVDDLLNGALGCGAPVLILNLGGEENDLKLVADEVVEFGADVADGDGASAALSRADSEEDDAVEDAYGKGGESGSLPCDDVAEDGEKDENNEHPGGGEDEFQILERLSHVQRISFWREFPGLSRALR